MKHRVARGFLAFGGLALCLCCTAGAETYPADNTGKNVRDRDPGAMTAGEQSNNKGDVKITQRIRKAVVADKSLSTNAHNVKIITDHGFVTLRGPVDNPKEKEVIGAKARRVVGPKRVDNQLEIASQ